MEAELEDIQEAVEVAKSIRNPYTTIFKRRYWPQLVRTQGGRGQVVRQRAGAARQGLRGWLLAWRRRVHAIGRPLAAALFCVSAVHNCCAT